MAEICRGAADMTGTRVDLGYFEDSLVTHTRWRAPDCWLSQAE
jgi:hypothetical protein